jgi:hypothetical protein
MRRNYVKNLASCQGGIRKSSIFAKGVRTKQLQHPDRDRGRIMWASPGPERKFSQPSNAQLQWTCNRREKSVPICGGRWFIHVPNGMWAAKRSMKWGSALRSRSPMWSAAAETAARKSVERR